MLTWINVSHTVHKSAVKNLGTAFTLHAAHIIIYNKNNDKYDSEEEY